MDDLRRSMQSVRRLATRLPAQYHVDQDDNSINNRRVVRFKDDKLINKDVGHAKVNA